MKKLELNQMEILEGGLVNCSDGLGFAVGFTAMFVIATIATGGVALAVGSIAAAAGGSVLSVGNCRNTGWL
jgi:hypothetical protein